MSELDTWAEDVGYRPGCRASVIDDWLDRNPERVAQIVEARSRLWAWKRIAAFLQTRAAFPYTSNPLQEACKRRGIL